MTAVITAPRWEWRIFAPKLEDWRAMPERASHAAFASTETYVLSEFSPHILKLSHGGIDVITLGARSNEGLDIWIPEVSAAFPIDKKTLDRAYHALGLLPLLYTVEATPLDAFMRLVAEERSLHLATVQRLRWPVQRAHCHGEFAELLLNGVTFDSLSFSDADSGRVRDAVHSIGFEMAANTSYPEALRQMLDIPALEEAAAGP